MSAFRAKQKPAKRWAEASDVNDPLPTFGRMLIDLICGRATLKRSADYVPKCKSLR